MSYTHIKKITTKNQYHNSAPGQKMTGIIIHSVGVAQSDPMVFYNYFNNPSTKASVHGIIAPGQFIETEECFNTKGYAKRTYHVGKGPSGATYNYSRFGFEMVEPKTIKYTTGANFTDSNPAETKKFILAVTATAAEVIADLCIYHDLPVSSIQTHKGAHAEGMGSAHADPDHIWSYIGYSITQFRKDVQTIINNKTTPKKEVPKVEQEIITTQSKVYKTLESIPSWGQDTVKKLINKGYIKGTGAKCNNKNVYDISEDLLRTLVILERAGVL